MIELSWYKIGYKIIIITLYRIFKEALEMIKPNYLNVTFNPDDLANSEVWWIQGYWKTIKELWKELKGTELEIVTKENIMEFLELNMKAIYFSIGGKND